MGGKNAKIESKRKTIKMGKGGGETWSTGFIRGGNGK